MLRVRSIADAARRSGWNHYQLRDGWLFQVERSTTGGVEISVHPDKGLSRILLVWRRIERVWHAAVEMPRDKQALAFRPYVGKSTPQLIHDSLVVADGEEPPRKEKKSRDVRNGSANRKSRISRLDSLRHA